MLESNGTGVDTKVSAREGVAAVVLDGEELGTETGVDCSGLPRRLDSSSCASVGSADMLAITEDSIAGDEFREIGEVSAKWDEPSSAERLIVAIAESAVCESNRNQMPIDKAQQCAF